VQFTTALGAGQRLSREGGFHSMIIAEFPLR